MALSSHQIGTIVAATTIGVTGHRVLSEPDRIEAGIEVALDEIERTWPSTPLQLISALADGADRLVAQAVRRRIDSRNQSCCMAQWSMLAVLPLAVEEYRTDFTDAASQ